MSFLISFLILGAVLCIAIFLFKVALTLIVWTVALIIVLIGWIVNLFRGDSHETGN